MGPRKLLLVAVIGWATVGEVRAQEAAAPPPFRLTPGARVRLSLGDGRAVEALLAHQDEGGVTIAFPNANPLAPAPQMTVPQDSIRRLEVSLGKKRHGWIGAAVGAVAMGLTGLREPIDTSESCGYNSDQACSRAEAIVVAALAGAMMGGVIGHFVQTESWAPVALDAMAPAPPTARDLRAAPGGPAIPAASPTPLGLSIRF